MNSPEIRSRPRFGSNREHRESPGRGASSINLAEHYIHIEVSEVRFLPPDLLSAACGRSDWA
eukprot:764197-Hanusia_phi.AAC.1